MVAPIAHRRPWPNRSSIGPISGATIANGSMVRPRNSDDLAAGLAGRHLEEQGAGQGDRDRRVAGGVERAELDQPRQPAGVGTLRGGRAARRTERRRRPTRPVPRPTERSPRPVPRPPTATESSRERALGLPGRGHASILPSSGSGDDGCAGAGVERAP